MEGVGKKNKKSTQDKDPAMQKIVLELSKVLISPHLIPKLASPLLYTLSSLNKRRKRSE